MYAKSSHSSIILLTVLIVFGIGMGAAYFAKGGDQLLGNLNKVISNSAVTFEVSEERLAAGDEVGPQGSVLLARFKIKADSDVVISNIQMNLVDNAKVADNVSYLYIKYPTDKLSAEQNGYSKIKWKSGEAGALASPPPRFNNLHLEVPANSEDVRIDLYAKLTSHDTGETLQAIFESFGYLDATSSVVKITDVNFTSAT